ncbi:MAG: GNAT family N-acetyltransferase [Candidatus Thermoplasmatota archaeon]|nr:GNAT family N-acetyltransferase [Candidatus Thermoplasmatota archaeon]
MKQDKDITIFRPVKKDDINQLYTLLNELTPEAKFFFHPHSFDKKTITEICTSGKDHYFVMLLKDVIIGYSMLRLFGYKIPSFGCCIRSQYGGKGYGSMLTSWTLQKAKELNYDKIILKVHKDNSHAFQMYKKEGFVVTGEIPEKNEIKMEIQLKE